MKVTALDESVIQDIGHAFGYYDYGTEDGLITAFPSRDAAASFICGYVRMALQSGILYTTGENKEGFLAYLLPGQKISLKAGALGVFYGFSKNIFASRTATAKGDVKRIHLLMHFWYTLRGGNSVIF